MREPHRYTALLLDFGGVMTTSIWDSFADFCRERGLEENTVKRLFRDDPGALADLRQLETGEIEENEFEQRFADRLGLDATDLIESMFRGMLPEESIVAAVRAVRAGGFKTGLISNSWSTSHYDRDLLTELFDDVVISAEVGLHKPQPEIFRLAVQHLDESPERCVFVDDLRENCRGAEAVGMTAILHRDPAQTVARIEELFDVKVSLETPGADS